MIFTSKPKVALVVLNHLGAGGAHGYEGEVISALINRSSLSFDFLIFAPKKLITVTRKRFPNLEVCYYRSGLLTMFLLSLRNSLQGYKILKAIGMRHGGLERTFSKHKISLAYFLSPNPLALDLVDTPMINTVWDLAHRDIPEFVEITGDRHFEEREMFFKQVLPKSFRIIVDTRKTSDQVRLFYGVQLSRIIVSGLRPVRPLPIHNRIISQAPYLLYPAQFWPHKRHVLLLKAFKIVLDKNPELRLVLTGSDKGNLRHVINVAKQLGISHAVDFKGFVETTELANLMADAKCVVFPSQLGPSNLPPVEAAMLGTPCLISNVHHDPALNHPLIQVVNTQRPESWALEINNMLSMPKVDALPLENPKSEFVDLIEQALDEFFKIRVEWSIEFNKPFKRID